MKVETEINDEFAAITITVERRIGKRMSHLVLKEQDARKILLEKHPELLIEVEPELYSRIDNNKQEKLKATWKFKKIVEKPSVEEKKPTKKPKTILTFKPKDAKVEETTQPAPEAKGVEEPTE